MVGPGGGPPFVVIQVPLDGDPMMPARFMLYGGPTGWVPGLRHAVTFETVKEATKKANQLMHGAGEKGNVHAEAVSYPVVWALMNGTQGPWRKVPPKSEVDHAPTTT